MKNAELYLVQLKAPNRLKQFISKGLPCDNFVNKVLKYSMTKKKNIVKVNFK